MPNYVVLDSISVTTSAPAFALVSSDTLYVAQNATLYYSGSSTGFAVTSTGNEEIAVAGALSSARSGAIVLSGDTSTHYVRVFQSGLLYSYLTAIRVAAGGLHLINNGEITASNAVDLRGSDESFIVNTGTISGEAAITSTGSGTIHLANSGTIMTTAVGTGAYYSYVGAYGVGVNAVDDILNSGTMFGSVYLGNGADTYDGTFGKVVGSIAGGQGADRIVGGQFSDVIYGDESPDSNFLFPTTGGNDYLWGGAGDDIIYGGYGADEIYGNQDNDILYGNQDNDFIHGGQGDDVIYGGQGNDTVNGGKGDDGLFGNLGDDYFVFNASFGHDVIYDFRNGADVIVFSTDVFSDFATVQSHTTAVLNGALITDNAGDTLLIVGVTPASLTSAMFAFG